jgi:cell volume regulation protein A
MNLGISIEYLLVVGAGLLMLGIIASKASGRLGVPALVLFLLIGMLAGSEGPGGIPFDDAQLAQSIGVVALVLILFSGGLDTEWRVVRPALWTGLSLSTLGVLVTALSVGVFATLVLPFSLLEGLLLGAIVSSTDAAAVFAVLRSRGVGLKGRIAPVLELESGSNDPMAVFLTIGLTLLLTTPGSSLFDLAPLFASQMVLGAALGYGMGRVMTFIVNRIQLEYEGLYPVLALALILLTYGATTLLGGNGFLATYLAGLVMGNQDFTHKRSIMRFHDGLAWLMQIAMFLSLGLLVFPSRLVPVIGIGLLVAAFLIFVARPISVFLALLFAKMELPQKTMVAWVGLRGAVPIILATFPLLAGVPQADTIFNLVFFIVLTSVLIQGTSLPMVARWLGVATPIATQYRYPLEFVPEVNIDSQLIEVRVPHASPITGRSITQLDLPKGALVITIGRDNHTLVPSGATVLRGGDRLLVLADNAAATQVHNMMSEAPAQVTARPAPSPVDERK